MGGWLEMVQISQLSEWDVLMFLHRHGTSLASAPQIALLLGQDSSTIGTALERLEALGLVQPSRSNGGVRFYRFVTPANSDRRESVEQLLTLSAKRAGRLIVVRRLRECAQSLGSSNSADSYLSIEGNGEGTTRQ